VADFGESHCWNSKSYACAIQLAAQLLLVGSGSVEGGSVRWSERPMPECNQSCSDGDWILLHGRWRRKKCRAISRLAGVWLQMRCLVGAIAPGKQGIDPTFSPTFPAVVSIPRLALEDSGNVQSVPHVRPSRSKSTHWSVFHRPTEHAAFARTQAEPTENSQLVVRAPSTFWRHQRIVRRRNQAQFNIFKPVFGCRRNVPELHY
jgi:hypothetical protein